MRLVAREAKVHTSCHVQVTRDSDCAAGLDYRREDVFLGTPALLEVLLIASEVPGADTGIKFYAFGSSEVILNGKAVTSEFVASDFTAVSVDAVCAGAVDGEVQSPIRSDEVTQTG